MGITTDNIVPALSAPVACSEGTATAKSVGTPEPGVPSLSNEEESVRDVGKRGEWVMFDAGRMTPLCKVRLGEDPIRHAGSSPVTVAIGKPRGDGSRGSALYAVPFTAISHPDSSWASHLERTWDGPPSWTNIHRPGIARVRATS